MSENYGLPPKDPALIEIKRLRAERDALAEDVEQLRVQLAGCGVIAGSNTEDSLARAMPGKDAYGYSASLADVERCVRREIALRTERDALREEVSLRRHTMPAEYAKLLAQRDYAMEMVNVQDNKIDALRHDIKRHVAIAEEQAQTIDALRALLREARAALPDMRHNELLRAKLDAALKDKP